MFMGPASALGELTFGMNDAGVVAFYRGSPGRIVTSDGVTERIIAEQSADFVPQPHRAAINDAGRVAFVASDGTGAAARRVLVGDGTDTHQVLHAGDSIPGLGTVLDVAISNDAINDVDQVAILVTYDDGTGVVKYAIVRANPSNRAPVATDGALTATEDLQTTGQLEATDPDGNALVFSVVSNGSLGTVTITNAATGQFSYSPAADANGSDTFTFKVNDGIADSNVATVTVSISPVNDAPLAANATGSVLAGQTRSGMLVASDADGDPLTYAIVSNGTQGTSTITNSSTGAYTYEASVGSSGTDTFTFKTNDSTVDSNAAMVTMTIAAPSACAADVTAVVEVVGSASRIDRKTGNLTQKVTLKNVGSSSLAGPIVLVLDSLPSGLNVINPSGTTACTAPFGSPYVMVNIGADSVLKVRERATVELRFTQAGSAPLNYTARVLAGAGSR
jgi:VCBS repeat-containing protein